MYCFTFFLCKIWSTALRVKVLGCGKPRVIRGFSTFVELYRIFYNFIISRLDCNSLNQEISHASSNQFSMLLLSVPLEVYEFSPKL